MTEMSKKQMVQILAYFRVVYTNGAEPDEKTAAVWFDLFKDYPYELVWAAARQVVRTWESSAGTMPSPAVLMNAIRQISPDQDTSIGMWREAEKAIRKGTRLSGEDFEKLPEPVRMYFGSTTAIRELALAPQHEVANERARFLKQAQALADKAEARKGLPPDMQKILDGAMLRITSGGDRR